MADSPTEMASRAWLRTAEAARLVGCCPNTIRNAVYRGEIRSQRVGPKLIYVRAADVLSRYGVAGAR